MNKRVGSLAIWAAASAIMAGTSLAADVLLPAASAPPATAPAPAPAAAGALRLSPTTPHPLESLPIEPDPVRFGGFHPKAAGPPMSFLGEGAFVYQRPALFSVDAEGKAILQFDPDPRLGKDAKPPPPVYVLPNLKRMAIEDVIKGRGLPLIVSGTATEFDGHNYLLLDDDTRPAGPPTTAPAPPPVTRPTTAAKNLSADEMLGQLLRTAPGSATPRPAPLRWDQPPETDKTSGGGAVSPGAAHARPRRQDRRVHLRFRWQSAPRPAADHHAVRQARPDAGF
jgi:hypothetical protein